MLSVKGTIQNGVAKPDESLEGFEGKSVMITVLEEEEGSQPTSDIEASWDRLLQTIEDCKVSTGIGDLAHQHDHYLHGTPKKP
jgi:hypothetical protein